MSGKQESLPDNTLPCDSLTTITTLWQCSDRHIFGSLRDTGFGILALAMEV